jgi:hypothetical protein
MTIVARMIEIAADLPILLARLAGFEPATRCLEGSRSVQLSYRRPATHCA